MLSNAYLLAQFCFDTAENELAKNLLNFANILQTFARFANFSDFANRGRRALAPPRDGADHLDARRGFEVAPLPPFFDRHVAFSRCLFLRHVAVSKCLLFFKVPPLSISV